MREQRSADADDNREIGANAKRTCRIRPERPSRRQLGTPPRMHGPRSQRQAPCQSSSAERGCA
eukprot:960451-Prymnesium_polylepis.1